MFLFGGKVWLAGFRFFVPKHLRNIINGNAIGKHRFSQSSAQIMELLTYWQANRHTVHLINLSQRERDDSGVYGAFARRKIRFDCDAVRPLRM